MVLSLVHMPAQENCIRQAATAQTNLAGRLVTAPPALRVHHPCTSFFIQIGMHGGAGSISAAHVPPRRMLLMFAVAFTLAVTPAAGISHRMPSRQTWRMIPPPPAVSRTITVGSTCTTTRRTTSSSSCIEQHAAAGRAARRVQSLVHQRPVAPRILVWNCGMEGVHQNHRQT